MGSLPPVVPVESLPTVVVALAPVGFVPVLDPVLGIPSVPLSKALVFEPLPLQPRASTPTTRRDFRIRRAYRLRSLLMGGAALWRRGPARGSGPPQAAPGWVDQPTGGGGGSEMTSSPLPPG